VLWQIPQAVHEGMMADVNPSLYQHLFKQAGFRDWILIHLKYHTVDFGAFLGNVRETVGSKG
jgi:hypothetical protein